MDVFLGTLIIFGLCCLAMSLGLLFSGRPFSGGCANRPHGTPRCEGCPKRNRNGAVPVDPEGGS